MIAGGNLWLHFDACSHLFYASLRTDVIAQADYDESAVRILGYINSYFFFLGAITMIIWRPSIFGHCST
jgi:hypothetical protein